MMAADQRADANAMRHGETGSSYLTITDVRERLQVSRAGVYRLFERGLPYVMVGHKRRVSEDALSAWLTGGNADVTEANPEWVYKCHNCEIVIHYCDTEQPETCPCHRCGRETEFIGAATE